MAGKTKAADKAPEVEVEVLNEEPQSDAEDALAAAKALLEEAGLTVTAVDDSDQAARIERSKRIGEKALKKGGHRVI